MVATMALTVLVASGVALAVTKLGGPGPDVLRGTDGRDYLDSRGSDDIIYGLGGNDNSPNLFVTGEVEGGLIGGFGDDTIYGGPGNDDMVGNEGFVFEAKDKGRDKIYGGGGKDRMHGGFGADVLYGGPGDDPFIADGEERGGALDILYGGGGDDTLAPRNVPAGKDIVYCGGGRDTVYADREDVLFGCERVRFGNFAF